MLAGLHIRTCIHKQLKDNFYWFVLPNRVSDDILFDLVVLRRLKAICTICGWLALAEPCDSLLVRAVVTVMNTAVADVPRESTDGDDSDLADFSPLWSNAPQFGRHFHAWCRWSTPLDRRHKPYAVLRTALVLSHYISLTARSVPDSS